MGEAHGERQEDEWEPRLSIDLPAYLPEEAIPEADLRISLYRRLAGADSEAALG